MQTLKNVVTGLCSIALVLAPVAAPLALAVAEEPWEIVPEDTLRDLRGGVDLGDLVASFAIERVVEIDGVVVARMQLVISNLDRLAKGGMPTITVTGPMAEIVQFMKTAGNVSVAGANGSIPASVASLPTAAAPQTGPSVPPVPPAAAASVATAAKAAPAAPTVASSGNSGSVSATGTQSGSMAQMGSALSNAVIATGNATSQPQASTSGTGTTAAPSTASSLASTTTSAANAPATALSSTHLQASATPTLSAQPVSTSAVPADTSKTIPVGTTGQVVVLNSLPNAAALTTAVQNEVHAATIQTQTTISATINSIPALNAISLANSIRTQVSGGGG
jgi:hypothetical protein